MIIAAGCRVTINEAFAATASLFDGLLNELGVSRSGYQFLISSKKGRKALKPLAVHVFLQVIRSFRDQEKTRNIL